MAKMISTFTSNRRPSESEMTEVEEQIFLHLQSGETIELKNGFFTKLENGDVLHKYTSSPLYSE